MLVLHRLGQREDQQVQRRFSRGTGKGTIMQTPEEFIKRNQGGVLLKEYSLGDVVTFMKEYLIYSKVISAHQLRLTSGDWFMKVLGVSERNKIRKHYNLDEPTLKISDRVLDTVLEAELRLPPDRRLLDRRFYRHYDRTP